MPIPITIEEYANIEAKELEVSNAHANVEQSKIEETKVEKVVQKTFTTDIKIGNTIEIIDGSFAGMIGNVVSLDNTRGIATIEMEMFGRITSVEVNYSMMKITE
jgi:transcriptional antiterminator NusG